jgi:uncharacterized membrane protein (UPF0127 family)
MSVPVSETGVAARLVRERDGAVVAERVELANTFGTRLVGLMGRAGIRAGWALWIEPCSSIHMMFVRFPIDVVFVGADKVVLKVVSRVRPWIGLAACLGARSAVELEAGAAERAGLAAGDRLCLEEELS